MHKIISSIFALFLLSACAEQKESAPFSLYDGLKETTRLQGQKNNGDYLYVTAGNRLYSIGNQYGNFPEVGFHVPGEMGGVWQHPIKLLDGFELSVNGAALDTCDQFIAYPFANQFEYRHPATDVTITRTDFVPDNLAVLVVEYLMTNHSPNAQNLDVTLRLRSDLSPVWLGERSGMTDTRDTLLETTRNTVILKDSLNDWYTGITFEADSFLVAGCENSPLKGKGISVQLDFPSQQLAPQTSQVLRFYVSGSVKNTTELEQNLIVAKENIEKCFDEKQQRYAEIDRRAAITIPDTLLMQAYQWGRYNTDWLVRDVPGMGRGVNAGLPDYPWFFSNDQASTFSALVGTVDPQLFYDSWEMLLRISNEHNEASGRIIHEVSTNGQVYDKGRMEESQGFINAAWEIFKWTGNREFLQTYYEQGKKVWTFLQKHDTNHNLYVEGYGGTEIEGLNDEMLDVAVSTQSFLQNMSQMASLFDEPVLSADYKQKADQLKKQINADWWSPSEKRYFDFIATKGKALELIDMALEKRVSDSRNRWAKEKLQGLKEKITKGQYTENGYIVFYNPPLGVLNEGIADPEKAIETLEGLPFFTNKFGLYISGIARPDDISLEEGSVAHRLEGEFNYHEAVMIAGTSGLAIAESKYRGSDAAMKYIRMILNNFSFATPGTTYEVSPDYGMFVQAWNVAGINIPLIHYIFGVAPLAHQKEITVKPDMPVVWEFAKLERLLIGGNELSVDFKKSDNQQTYTLTNTQPDWSIRFVLPADVKIVWINGKETIPQEHTVTLSGLDNRIEF